MYEDFKLSGRILKLQKTFIKIRIFVIKRFLNYVEYLLIGLKIVLNKREYFKAPYVLLNNFLFTLAGFSET